MKFSIAIFLLCFSSLVSAAELRLLNAYDSALVFSNSDAGQGYVVPSGSSFLLSVSGSEHFVVHPTNSLSVSFVVDPVTVDAHPVALAYLVPSGLACSVAVDSWTSREIFGAGASLGVLIYGVAFLFRIVRKIAAPDREV